jgi:hypothetical protein
MLMYLTLMEPMYAETEYREVKIIPLGTTALFCVEEADSDAVTGLDLHPWRVLFYLEGQCHATSLRSFCKAFHADEEILKAYVRDWNSPLWCSGERERWYEHCAHFLRGARIDSTNRQEAPSGTN